MNLYWRKNNSANWNPARIHPQTPPPREQNAKTKISRGFAKSFSPENSFGKTESAFRPATLPEDLEGRTPKEKHPFLFQKKFHPRQIRNARSVFSFGVAGVIASAWGFLRAHDLVSSHHARGACEVITSLCFGNRCEFGTIETPKTAPVRALFLFFANRNDYSP